MGDFSLQKYRTFYFRQTAKSCKIPLLYLANVKKVGRRCVALVIFWYIFAKKQCIIFYNRLIYCIFLLLRFR